MASLFTDTWFYVILAGFLVSSALFVYLFHEYRSAPKPETPSGPAPEPEPAPSPGGRSEASPTTPGAESEASGRTLAPRSGGTSAPGAERSGAAPIPVEEAKPQSSPPNPVQTLSGATIGSKTVGLSPAVAFLQNIKGQMEHFDKEIGRLGNQLSGYVQKNEQHFEEVLKHLDELEKEIHGEHAQKYLDELEKEIHGRVAPAAEPPRPEPAPAPKPAEKAVPVESERTQPDIQLPPGDNQIVRDSMPAPKNADKTDVLTPKGTKGPVWPV